MHGTQTFYLGGRLAQTASSRQVDIMKAPHTKIILITFALLCGGCSLSGEQADIAETLEETITALETGDLQKLWEVSAPQAREELTTLHAKIRRAMEVIDVVYPEKDRAAARRSIGGDFLGDIPVDSSDRGARLLGAFIKPDALRLDQKARDGLRNKGAQIDGDRATIKTTAGETSTFQRTSEGWRSALVVDILQRSAAFRRIEENVEDVIKLADGKRRLWVESVDPTTPNGAYNVLQSILSAPELDKPKLFTLMSKTTRSVFTEGLELSRAIQKLVRRGIPKAKRKSVYERHGIALLLRFRTDLEWFEHWCDSEAFKKVTLPAGEPAQIEGDIHAGVVTLITNQKERASFIREKDGFWHWADKEGQIRETLLSPLEAKLANLKGKGSN